MCHVGLEIGGFNFVYITILCLINVVVGNKKVLKCCGTRLFII